MDCRTDEPCSLKRNLGCNLHDVINTKEQTVLKFNKFAILKLRINETKQLFKI